MKPFRISDGPLFKQVESEDYNLLFNKKTGFTARWGKTPEDDPQYCPYGCEILDMEISSAASNDVSSDNPLHIVTNHGCAGPGCRSFCYKAQRSDKSVHMSLDTFKAIMDRMPKVLCSIAFGVLSPIEQHPQVWDIFEECRNRGVIPNVTINQAVTEEVSAQLSRLCGAVAVSVNKYNREIAYNTIAMLSKDYGMTQVNIHIVLSNDTVEFIKSVVDDIQSDARLSKMNALVMLSFKDKAKSCAMTSITSSYYRDVIEYCMEKEIRFGFDSCSAKCFENSIKDYANRDELIKYVEPCESLLFSCYIDVNAKMYACSFLENSGFWLDGIDILEYNSLDEVWNSEKVWEWRKLLVSNGRACPEYSIGGQ